MILLILCILSSFLIACGELSLSPVGLATVTQLSPRKFVGMITGMWFLCLAAAYVLAGYIAKLTSIPANVTDPLVTNASYGSMFGDFGIVCIVAGLLMILVAPKLKKLMA